MSVEATDLVIYGSAVMADNDVTTEIGGAIDLTTLVVFADIVATDQVEALSNNGADTMNLTVYSRNVAGELIVETKALTGATPVAFATGSERILKWELASVAAGAVTLRDVSTATTIGTMPAGVTAVRRVFYDAYAEDAGGATRVYYEKVFYRNNHAAFSLTSAVISEGADPSGNIAFALETALSGSDTNGVGNNRLVAPGGYSFDSSAKNVANNQNHTAQAGQGVWLELTLPAGEPADNTSYTLVETGRTV